MQKTQLKKRQRDIVQYFMRYVIENKEIKKKEIARRQSTANQLVDDLEPARDDFDRRILFEISKRRVDAEDFHDDTSYEEDFDFGDDDDEGFGLGNLIESTMGPEEREARQSLNQERQRRRS